jgi:hypothetical protein
MNKKAARLWPSPSCSLIVKIVSWVSVRKKPERRRLAEDVAPSLFVLVLVGIALELSRRLLSYRMIAEGEAILILCLAWAVICGALILRLACVYDFCPLGFK